jgi:hypothetical protein
LDQYNSGPKGFDPGFKGQFFPGWLKKEVEQEKTVRESAGKWVYCKKYYKAGWCGKHPHWTKGGWQ